MEPEPQQAPSGHIGAVLGPTDHVWRRWVENPFAFYYTPLAIATAVLLFVPGPSWRERIAGVVVSGLTALWYRRWILHVRADAGAHALAHRLLLALVGVVLTSILAVIHDAYLVNLLMLVMHFFVALPVAWSVLLTILIAFPTGRMYDTHGEIPNATSEIISVLFLRVPIMVMFGIVVRTAAAQNEERRRLLDTLAAAQRRAGILEERQRLAREIHDTLAQGFAAIVMHLEQADVASAAARQAEAPGSVDARRVSDAVRPHLDFARAIARENLEEARRMLSALRPEVLDQEGGLGAAIERVCSEWSQRAEIPCTVHVTGDVVMLHSEVEVMLLRGTQDLLANVRKHARATHVTVTLSYITDVVALDVHDDGAGIVPNASRGWPTDAARRRRHGEWRVRAARPQGARRAGRRNARRGEHAGRGNDRERDDSGVPNGDLCGAARGVRYVDGNAGRAGMTPIRIVIADDHPIVRSGLRMPELDGVGAIREMCALVPPPKILVLTTYDTDADILRAVEAGATGYLLKETPREELFSAIRATASGTSVLSPSVASRLVGRARESGEKALSAREIEVLMLVARGTSNKLIARDLEIGETTVKTHLLHIFSKLGVDDRTAAVTTAVERGIIRL